MRYQLLTEQSSLGFHFTHLSRCWFFSAGRLRDIIVLSGLGWTKAREYSFQVWLRFRPDWRNADDNWSSPNDPLKLARFASGCHIRRQWKRGGAWTFSERLDQVSSEAINVTITHIPQVGHGTRTKKKSEPILRKSYKMNIDTLTYSQIWHSISIIWITILPSVAYHPAKR